MTEHECVFVEEQEPSGRLILPPCIVCGVTAMDALDQVRRLTEAGGSLAQANAALALVTNKYSVHWDRMAQCVVVRSRGPAA